MANIGYKLNIPSSRYKSNQLSLTSQNNVMICTKNTFYKKNPWYLECPFLLHVTLTISSTCKGTVLYVKTMTDTTPSHTLAL